ncbi:MAG TPA: glycosyltransferase family 39 protein [Bryobacteraceae bacterium]|nr:glycosyltransferase family 39 protein [Bryobacteraceae bacterium]
MLNTAAQTSPPVETGLGLERHAAALERFLERHQAWVLALWSVVYFGGTMVRARAYPFWYDEILALLEARQPTVAAAIGALRDADWMPPAHHVVLYLTDKLLGHGEVAFRIPAMIGFWVFSICLFVFARRRVGVVFALLAMLLPYASSFQAYSFEARSYAFVLGFGGIALVSWQAATAGIGRPWSLVGLALGIAGAVAFHYWAVLIYLPLGGAELYRTVRQRRIDWPVWAAMLAGGLSLAASLYPILQGLQSWSPHGAQVHRRMYWNFYRIEFRVFYAFAIPAAALLAAWFLLGGRKEQPAEARRTAIPDYEWVAAVLFLLIPVAAISIALASPHQVFALRYAALTVTGYALLVSFVAARLAERRSAIGVACVVAALAPFTYLITHPEYNPNPPEPTESLRRALEKETVVSDILVPQFVEIWYYLPDSLKPRFVTLSPTGADEKEWPFLGEFAKIGVPVGAYRDFAIPGKTFLLYTWRHGDFEKMMASQGATMEPVASTRRYRLVRVHSADQATPRVIP